MFKTEIIDNFLDNKEFEILCNHLSMDINGNERTDSQFPFSWIWQEDVAYNPNDPNSRKENDEVGGQFVHLFQHCLPFQLDSPHVKILWPIYNLIQPFMILRAKANLQVKTKKRELTPFHHDFGFKTKDPDIITNGILYVNTNNGYTEFEDGSKIESIANRFVLFSNSLKHRGVTCTDTKKRVVINFNFIFDRL